MCSIYDLQDTNFSGGIGNVKIIQSTKKDKHTPWGAQKYRIGISWVTKCSAVGWGGVQWGKGWLAVHICLVPLVATHYYDPNIFLV